MQVPQLHAGDDVNELKVRQGSAMKPGIYQQHLGQCSNYYHHQLKQSGAFPISSPQNFQASSPQISHHSPEVDQHNPLSSQVKTGTPLHSANSPFVPSSSPSVAPSPMSVDSDKPHSNIPSLTNTGQAGQHTAVNIPSAPDTKPIKFCRSTSLEAKVVVDSGILLPLQQPCTNGSAGWMHFRLFQVDDLEAQERVRLRRQFAVCPLPH